MRSVFGKIGMIYAATLQSKKQYRKIEVNRLFFRQFPVKSQNRLQNQICSIVKKLWLDVFEFVTGFMVVFVILNAEINMRNTLVIKGTMIRRLSPVV